MRILALAILTIATVLTATPTVAQTYDPKYPVCLQIETSRTGASIELIERIGTTDDARSPSKLSARCAGKTAV